MATEGYHLNSLLLYFTCNSHENISLLNSELLRQNTGLTVPILDALSNLNLRPELLAEVSFSRLTVLKNPSKVINDLNHDCTVYSCQVGM